VGWKTQVFDSGTAQPNKEPYTMWLSTQGPMGGVSTLPEEAKKMGAPPHWMGNVIVDDLKASVAKVTALGGKILVPPTEIPKVGRFGVVADPQGAAIALVQFDAPMNPHDTSKTGEIQWNELVTTDNVAALKFYSALFGWKQLSEMDMGPIGKYVIYGQGDKQYG